MQHILLIRPKPGIFAFFVRFVWCFMNLAYALNIFFINKLHNINNMIKLHSWYDNKLKCMLTHHGNSICWWLLVVWTQPLTGLGSPEYLLLYSLMSLALCLPSSVKFSSAEKLANRMVTCKYVTKPHKIWHLLWHKISIKKLHFHWEALCPLEFQFLVQFIYSIQQSL